MADLDLALERSEANATLASHRADPISCGICGPATGRFPCPAVDHARTLIALLDRLERMEPVVTAARAWRHSTDRRAVPLIEAVDAYEKAGDQ